MIDGLYLAPRIIISDSPASSIPEISPVYQLESPEEGPCA